MSWNLAADSDSTEQRKILDALPALVFLEQRGLLVFANVEARRILGLQEGEWLRRPVEEVLWGLFTGTAEPRTLLKGAGKGSPFHATVPTKSGKLLPIEGTYSILNAERREAVIVAHPSRREGAPKARLTEDVLASIPEAVVIEHRSHVLYTNPAFTRMFGYSADEASGESLCELIVPETRLSEMAMLEKAVDDGERVMMETVRMTKDGELVDVSLQAAPLTLDGARAGHVYTFRDIGDRKEAEAKLQHDALHDPLTGMPNRALFQDRLSLALTRQSRRKDQRCGVLFIDLDRFKEVNDALGHAAGDALLVSVAERLRGALRPQDSAARLSGDEFAVLVENAQTSADLDIVARRVLHEMLRPFDVFGHMVQAGASIGVAMAGADYTTPELLIRDADFAMYQAKQAGGGRYEVFDRHLEVIVSSQQERERELRQVLDERRFEIWYEPIYRLDSGRLEGFESLLRWRKLDGSADSFRDLLLVAEETGLSVTLGRETLDAVCAQLNQWAVDLPRESMILTVNLTHRQFFQRDLIAHLRKTLSATGANPARLLFEVPESTLNENPDAAVAILQRMVDCEVRVAIDHFGSSLAPLNHLVRLPIDMVKLDPKLAIAATLAGRQRALLESLVRLGRTLDVQVVAQGIETAEQLRALCAMGCELGQGRLLSDALDPLEAQSAAERGRWPVPPEEIRAGSRT